ncbi:MAG: response regulator [Betaproteobacteria bacterium]|nr:response regulator [Betaproteobacteria bacterium]
MDDDQTVREVMERHLTREGFAVVTANGGQEGLRLARELHPAAITLDVMMPDLDGWTVLAAIKGDPELADIPVILMTIVDEKNRGYALGATDYMVKPVDRERLSGVLRNICGAVGRQVLLVDDDDLMRRGMRLALEKDGWEVGEAENGRVALARIEATRPDIIMLDLMMPEMDGFEFLVEMRGRVEWRDIPVLVVTAKDLTAEERSRLNGDVARVLQKGGSGLDALLAEIARVLPGSIARARQEGRGRNAMRILYVEDNEDNIYMLERRLKRAGFDVLIARDGAEGVAMAGAEQPDLILMDMGLPVLDGWEATRQIKAEDRTRHIPVIALTANAMSGDREKAMAAGCDDFDTKPVELPRLLEKIQALAPGGPAA